MTKFRKLIASLSVVAILSTLVVSSAVSASTFNDVPADAYFAEAVEALVESGCVDTKGKTSFFPNNSTTRAEVAKLLVCATGKLLPEAQWPATGSFPDVEKTSWAFPFVESAKAAGIVNGYANGNFGPNDLITREQFAKMVVEAFDLPMMTHDLSTFADSASLTQPWAPGYMQTAVHFGVVTGSKGADGKTYLNPTQPATRGQAVTMINRATDSDSSEEGEDDEDSEEGEEDEETTYEGGSLEIELSDNSPEGDTVPGSVANAHVATFTLSAGDEDVRVTSLEFKRTGLGDDGAFDDIALVSEDGARLSKAKSFNSDDLAVVNMLDGGFVIEAGESVDVKVLGTVGAATGNGNFKGDSFGVALLDADAVQSSADDVEGDFPVASELFEVGGADAGTITITDDGQSPDVSVGERDVEIAALEVEGDNNNDVELYALRLEQTGSVKEESDLANFRLYIEGEEVAMAEEAMGGFVNFMLDEPFLFEDSKSYEVRVHADVLGGAGEDIAFEFDSELDVEAVDVDYGFGAGVDLTGFDMTGAETNVKAGAVTVVGMDPDFDSIDADKDNLILATLEISANTGDSLELQKLEFTFTNSDTDLDLDDTFENVEIVTSSGTYDLTGASIDDNVGTYTNDDLDILIREGETLKVDLRVDTKEEGAGFDLDDLDLVISLDSIGGTTKATSDLYIEETTDDQPVEDITPSTLSFNALEGSETSAEVTALVQSDRTVVVGSKNVEAMAFQVEAGNAADLRIRDVVLNATVNAPATFSSVTVSKASLYVDSISEANLLTSKSGSQISGGSLRLDFASKAVTVKADETRKFYVTLDFVDSQALNNGNLTLEVVDLDIKDGENDDVTPTDASGDDLSTTNEVDSTRTITLSGTGSLTTTVDTSDVYVNKSKLVLSGTTSDTLASFELTATNEPILLQDIALLETENGVDLEDYISEIILLKEDRTTEIARKAVTSNSTLFTGLDYKVMEGSENVYVKAVAHRYGKDLPGSQSNVDADLNLALVVTKARGFDSGKTLESDLEIDVPNNTNISSQSGNTLTFAGAHGNAIGDVFLLDEDAADVSAPAPYYVMVVSVPSSTELTVLKTSFADIGTVDTSNEAVTTGTLPSNLISLTGTSLGFAAVPVQINGVSFLASYSGESLPTGNKLSNGDVTAAIIKLDNANHSNTNTSTGAQLDTLVDQVQLTQSRFSKTLVKAYTIERIGGAESTVNGYNMSADDTNDTLTFTVPAADPGENIDFYVNDTLVSVAFDTDQATTGAALVTALEAVTEIDDPLTAYSGGTLTVGAGNDILLTWKNITQLAGEASPNLITFDLTSLTSDNQITRGQSAYYVVKADVVMDSSVDVADDFLRLSFDGFNDGQITFQADDAAGALDQLRLAITSLTGIQLNQ